MGGNGQWRLGGSGAAGNGGPSYAFVYKGTVPTKQNGTMLSVGAGGSKGIGGSVQNAKAPDGSAGATPKSSWFP